MLYRLIIRKLITNNLDFHIRTLPNLKIVKLAVTIETVGGATRTRTKPALC
jgi:hypothetical protein